MNKLTQVTELTKAEITLFLNLIDCSDQHLHTYIHFPFYTM